MSVDRSYVDPFGESKLDPMGVFLIKAEEMRKRKAAT
jgi:hypothetical protein